MYCPQFVNYFTKLQIIALLLYLTWRNVVQILWVYRMVKLGVIETFADADSTRWLNIWVLYIWALNSFKHLRMPIRLTGTSTPGGRGVLEGDAFHIWKAGVLWGEKEMASEMHVASRTWVEWVLVRFPDWHEVGRGTWLDGIAIGWTSECWSAKSTALQC